MRLNTVIPLDVSADREWTLVAEEFGTAAEWASSATSSRLDRDRVEVGAQREAQVGKRRVIERVVQIAHTHRTFSYELIDPPAITGSSGKHLDRHRDRSDSVHTRHGPAVVGTPSVAADRVRTETCAHVGVRGAPDLRRDRLAAPTHVRPATPSAEQHTTTHHTAPSLP